MVRTKQPRKNNEHELLVKDFERQAAQKCHKLELDLQMQIISFTTAVDMALSTLPKEIQKMTLGELYRVDVDEIAEGPTEIDASGESENISPMGKKFGTTKKKGKRATAASDDGYATESTTRTTRMSRIDSARNSTSQQSRKRTSHSANPPARATQRISRSCQRPENKSSDAEQEKRRKVLKACPPTASKYKTPASKNPPASFALVTPKVKPNTPMNVLRRPRQGEMVLSMQGSPLLVSSIVQENTANINVPLTNGNVISLLPTAGLRMSTMPELDPETLRQLKTLKEHIDKVIGDGDSP